MKKITEKLKENGAGDFAVNYKLRDWIFSRQHYWGEPIPIIHCDKCGKVPVPEDQLPVVLPEVENYEPTDTGESPLAKITDWVNVKCPVCGEDAKRETDTMPNWAGSSWYYLAYALNKKLNIKDKKFTDILKESQELKHWMPVDLYNGGAEHITLHLLYSRFWNKFLYDLGVVPESEPYKKRIYRGIILGTDGRKMSKSFGNVINPDDMIAEFGADTLRAYIMFIGPYDQESAWNMNGIQGVHRFLKKVWENFKKVKEDKEGKDDTDSGRLILDLHKTIKGVSEDIERFSMNTYIAKLMEFNNLLVKEKSIPKNIAEMFLILLSPAMPYVTEELWEQIGNSDSIFKSEWPKFDQAIIDSDKLEIPIQINGKVRHRIHVSSDISVGELEKMVLAEKVVIDHLAGKEPKKVIVVPKKLVSIVS
jgi:leucyl-tRNA synthetase